MRDAEAGIAGIARAAMSAEDKATMMERRTPLPWHTIHHSGKEVARRSRQITAVCRYYASML